MSTARHNAEAAAALLGGLCAGGLRAVVVCPGSRSTPLALAASARRDLALYVVVDERAAGFLALGLARALAAPVALICTSGSAPLHFAPALAEAAATHAGLVVLTADRPVELHGVGAPQTLDQRRIFGALAGHARDLAAPDGKAPARSWALAGLDAAAAARAGQVAHLNLAFREPLWAPDGDVAPLILPAAVCTEAPRLPAADAVADLASRLAAQTNGLIHVGPHASGAPGFGAAVRRLGARLGWPVLAEAASGVRAGVEPDAVITAGEALARAPRFVDAHRPTAILRLGRAPHSRALNGWLAAARPALAVGVDRWGDRHDPEGLLTELWHAEPTALVDALAEALPEPAAVATWRSDFAAAERRARERLNTAAAEGLWAGTVSAALVRGLASCQGGGALQVASSMAHRDLDAFMPAEAGQRFEVTVSRGLNGIDGTVATAVGQALARAPAPSAVLLGDLACQHDLGGLAVAADLAAPLTAVVVHNGGGGIFDHLAIAAHPEHARLFRTPQPQVDLAAVARGLGVRAVEVHDADGLERALAEALPRPGADLIVAHIDAADDAARHRAAWAAAAEVIW